MEEISREEIAPLLERLPFGRKIDYLLNNQHLGSRKLTTLNTSRFMCDVYPNCFGTVLFLTRTERDFIMKFRYTRGENREYIIVSEDESFSVFPQNFNGPGSLEPEYMKFFLKEMCKEIQSLNVGSIVSIGGMVYDNEGIPEDYRELLHSAIYLGKSNGREYILVYKVYEFV